MTEERFSYHGARFPYWDHPYNTTRLNERAVEVPIAVDFIHRRSAIGVPMTEGLEVGNVLGHYVTAPWRRVDLYEQADGVENIDLFHVHGQVPWVVTISTVEHVRWDHDRDPLGGLCALHHLSGLLAPGGRMLVTVPLGHNPPLDRVIANAMAYPVRGDRHCLMVRDGDGWRQLDRYEEHGYGPAWANAVYVGETGRRTW